jgi:hypothetical protein
LEKGIYSRIREIKRLGHQIGLHFDVEFYDDIVDAETLEKKLAWEKKLIEDLFETDVNVFSFHNPNENILHYSAGEMAGMINTYSSTLQQTYFYCSDSNGYWRYHRLFDVLNKAKAPRLHVLTHPDWWTPEILSPRERISRCIEGRAKTQHDAYDELLQVHGRQNIGSSFQ